LPMVVSVNVRMPALISAGVGAEVAWRSVVFGVYDPAPPLQMPPVATESLPPSGTVALLGHTLASASALAAGAAAQRRVTWSLTAVHRPLPVVVRVSVTKPAATSAAVGV